VDVVASVLDAVVELVAPDVALVVATVLLDWLAANATNALSSHSRAISRKQLTFRER